MRFVEELAKIAPGEACPCGAGWFSVESPIDEGPLTPGETPRMALARPLPPVRVTCDHGHTWQPGTILYDHEHRQTFSDLLYVEGPA